DLTFVDPYRSVDGAPDIGFELLPGCGLLGDPCRDRHELDFSLRRSGGGRPHVRPAHAAVPPMVRAFTRRVGWPSPTGTPWPSLPHVPGLPMAKSFAKRSMSFSPCGPLPIRLPSRIGSVSSPFSIR